MMYQMGVYCRLSKDDGENKVSESIENQMKLIREYVTKSEDLEIADIYIDDGYSGLCAIFVPSDRVSRKAVQDGAGQTCNDKKQPYDGRRKNHILDGRRQQDLQQSEKSP